MDLVIFKVLFSKAGYYFKITWIFRVVYLDSFAVNMEVSDVLPSFNSTKECYTWDLPSNSLALSLPS